MHLCTYECVTLKKKWKTHLKIPNISGDVFLKYICIYFLKNQILIHINNKFVIYLFTVFYYFMKSGTEETGI